MKNLLTKSIEFSKNNKVLVTVLVSILALIILPKMVVFIALGFIGSYKFIKSKAKRISVNVLLGIIAFFYVIILIGEQIPETTDTDNPSVVEQVVSAISNTEQNQATSSEEVTNSASAQETAQNSTDTTKSSELSFYSVTQVVDGDTIKININGKEETLRLIGLDTPETVDPRKEVQCFGKEASNKAKELLSNKKVRIETDASQGTTDKYGRMLAYVYREDGLFYNKHMIEQGYAHEYTYGTPYKYQSEFKTAQKNAQASQIGLWSPSTCNGDTTSASTQTSTQTPTPTPPPVKTQSSGNLYYTSSHYTAKYYYPEACEDWKGLSPSYLKSYSTLEALLAIYPSKTKSPQCD